MTDELFDHTDDPRQAEAAAETYRGMLTSGTAQLRPDQPLDRILAMSSPPWHTATANPFIRDWVAKGARTAATERPNPGPYLDDVFGSKATLQYKAHSYPTKVPPEVIVRLLLHYTEPGDVVLDAFSGSGMTGVAAQMCAKPIPSITQELTLRGAPPKWGARRAVLNDLSPSGTFLASGVTVPVDHEAFEKASAALLKRLDDELGWMYETTTPDGAKATIDYTVWSEVFTCPHCGGAVVFYDAAFDPKTSGIRKVFPCPECGIDVCKKGRDAATLERRLERVRLLTGETINRIALRPVAIRYRVESGRTSSTGSKKLDDADRAVLARIASLDVAGAPRSPLPIDDMTHGSRLAPKGFTAVEHLYPDRALVSLSRLWRWANEESDTSVRRALKFWIEQAFWGLSWLNRFTPTHFSHVNQFLSGVYYVGSTIAECSPRYNLVGTRPSTGKRASLVKLWQAVPFNGDIRISTGDAAALPLDDESIDYIFVDPPFGANIPYADLAMIIESWHGVLTNPEREAIVDDVRGKGNPEYADLMADCFREFARVLKPGRWMTVEFSNSSNVVWGALQSALDSAGFVVADARVLDKSQNSYRQATAANAVKQDLMLSCYMPGAETMENLARLHSKDSVWSFVGDHLGHLPVTESTAGTMLTVRERNADKIYNRVVSYYVAAGLRVPMKLGEFYAGLDQHFNERDGMYFRPDQVETYERKRITFKELATADLFITDEKSAIAWLRQMLKSRPRPMSQIQPAFLKELGNSTERPDTLPDLRQLLEQSFVQNSDGSWLVPDPHRVEHLEQLRTRDLLRTFESYASGTGTLSRFRGEAILAGFKKAWADKDYATITRVGARLPQDYLVEMPAALAYLRNASHRQSA